MSKREIRAWKCICDKCEHQWQTRNDDLPIICPKCKTKKWDANQTIIGSIGWSLAVKEVDDKFDFGA
jgi:Zn finger protein HypA/HybF involved in hydrogenase expression